MHPVQENHEHHLIMVRKQGAIQRLPTIGIVEELFRRGREQRTCRNGQRPKRLLLIPKVTYIFVELYSLFL